MDNHSFWLSKFARLRIDTASNAPHKPLLLLVVLDLAEDGAILPSPIGRGPGEGGCAMLPLTPQLAFRFCSFWKIVAHRRKQKPDVRWPFTKLKTEGVWVPFDARDEPTFSLRWSNVRETVCRYSWPSQGVGVLERGVCVRQTC